MKIFLVGLPGSGKSTIGKALSLLSGYNFIDSDEEISKKEGASIETIFQEKGEPYFRECEKAVLKELLIKDNLIVSTGGGLPCFFDNMEVINQNGLSIFLNVPPSVIAERLWTDENQHRPLLQGKNKEQLLEFLILKQKERMPFYKKSTLEVEGNDISAENLWNKLRQEKKK